jgi:hypothetical protein
MELAPAELTPSTLATEARATKLASLGTALSCTLGAQSTVAAPSAARGEAATIISTAESAATKASTSEIAPLMTGVKTTKPAPSKTPAVESAKSTSSKASTTKTAAVESTEPAALHRRRNQQGRDTDQRREQVTSFHL